MKRVSLQEPLMTDDLRRLRDYWLEARGSRRMPSRHVIDPMEMPGILPHVVLTDVFHDPLRFRYRLIGTAITTLTGRDVTGSWLNQELYGDRTDNMLWTFRTCAETGEPVAVRQKAQFPDREWVGVEVLLLPLGKTDTTVEIILSGLYVTKLGGEYPSNDIGYSLDWRLDPQ